MRYLAFTNFSRSLKKIIHTYVKHGKLKTEEVVFQKLPKTAKENEFENRTRTAVITRHLSFN